MLFLLLLMLFFMLFLRLLLMMLLERKKEIALLKGHMKDIGSTVGETVLSLSPIPGGKITN